METKPSGFLEDGPGQKSSLRLNLFILLISAVLLLAYACYKSPAGVPLTFSDSMEYIFGFMLLLIFAPKLIDKFVSLKFGAAPEKAVPAESKEESKQP